MRSKKAILNMMSTLILQLVTLVCGFVIPRLIIEEYGSNINGLISSITQFLAYIALLESGVGPVVRATLYKPIAKKDKQEIESILKSAEKFFRTIAIIFVGYIIVLSIIYPLIVSKEFEIMYTLSLIIIISASTFAEYYFGMTYRLYLQSIQKSYVVSIIQIFGYILSTFTVVVLIKSGLNIHLVKLASGTIFVLRPIVQNIYVRKKYNIDLKSKTKDYKLEQKWDGLAQHIASVVHNNTDITILTVFATISEVSVYSLYYLVVSGVRSISLALVNGIDSAFGDMLAKGENDNLNKKYSTYETLYLAVNTILFVSTLILIIPFIQVYTLGITDVNYIRPGFSVILVISEFVWIIRQPYNELIKAAGHFKETKKGAWVEAITNIVLSIILVYKFGMIGVSIGTLVAMVIRTAEFIYHTSKYILKRSIWISIKKIIVTVVETLIIVCLINWLPSMTTISYSAWILRAIVTVFVAIIVVFSISITIYKNNVKEIFKTLKSILKK